MMCGNTTGQCVPKPEQEDVKQSKLTDINRFSVVHACELDPPKSDDTICLKNTTACKNSDDQVVCCMYTNGVCCGKEGLCCPSGYTCDAQNEGCQLNDDVTKEPIRLDETKCSGETSTSCQTGCCSSENAVCCSDGLNW